MQFRVRWTDYALGKLAAHGVSVREVNAALEGKVYKRVANDRLIVICGAKERILRIVLVRSHAQSGFVELVTARPANRREKRLFRRRGKVFR